MQLLTVTLALQKGRRLGNLFGNGDGNEFLRLIGLLIRGICLALVVLALNLAPLLGGEHFLVDILLGL